MNLKLILNKIFNENITVELKNGTIIHGVLIKSDKFMNLYLKKVKKTNFLAFDLNLENISIRGNTIRYIILPIWINFDSLLYLNHKTNKKNSNYQ